MSADRGWRADVSRGIAPGLVKTDFAKALWSSPGLLRKRTADTPLQRTGKPDEIAETAVFLAAPASGLMTGQAIVVADVRHDGLLSETFTG